MPLDREKNRKGLARSNGQDLMRGEHNLGERTTWVGGNRANRDLDDTSRKILAAGGQGQESSGTSIFDPVLCELVYRWFCPPKSRILDPFAGGSVRGLVASFLIHEYVGVDLSQRQLEANRKQISILGKGKPQPKWIEGDSKDLLSLVCGEFDLVFSCPPYADLEVYSEDPRDVSVIAFSDYSAFLAVYRQIIASCVALLKPNRFAVFVVGDVRGPSGFYRNLPAQTIQAFEDAGATLYNEAILVTAVGSLPIRIGKQFGKNRKLGKTHQNILVFYKGDPKFIAKDFPQVEVSMPESNEDQA